MANPKLILQIEQSTPQIVFLSDSSESKNMISLEEDLIDLFQMIDEKLNLKDEDIEYDISFINHMSRLASEGDEHFIDSLPKAKSPLDQFQLLRIVEQELLNALENLEDYSEVEDITNEVKDELLRNQKIDILASLIELTYNILIAKILEIASELEIDNIILHDHLKFGRLEEKMVNELSKMDLSLQVE